MRLHLSLPPARALSIERMSGNPFLPLSFRYGCGNIRIDNLKAFRGFATRSCHRMKIGFTTRFLHYADFGFFY